MSSGQDFQDERLGAAHDQLNRDDRHQQAHQFLHDLHAGVAEAAQDRVGSIEDQSRQGQDQCDGNAYTYDYWEWTHRQMETPTIRTPVWLGAWALRTITVVIEPGPEIIGMARGVTEGS